MVAISETAIHRQNPHAVQTSLVPSDPPKKFLTLARDSLPISVMEIVRDGILACIPV
jgi:hypothetical protein